MMNTLKIYLFFIFTFCSFLADAKTRFHPVVNSPFNTGTYPISVAFSPKVGGNVFAAVANKIDGNFSAYVVDLLTGNFKEIPGSPFAAGTFPNFVAFSPEIRENIFAAIVNLNNKNISVYSVDVTTGTFTEALGSPFSSGNSPSSITFFQGPTGSLFAAATNNDDDNVSVYAVNMLTGALTEILDSPFSAGSSPVSIAISPEIDGNLFAAVANDNARNISVYSVNGITGTFTEIPGSPFHAGCSPSSVAFFQGSAGNLFAAATNYSDDNVSVYAVDTLTGTFTEIPNSPFSAGFSPVSIAISPEIDGNLFAAVANAYDNNVCIYSVDTSSGAFTQIPGSPFYIGPYPASVAFVPSIEGNLFVAITNPSFDTVSVYQILPSSSRFWKKYEKSLNKH